MRKYDKQGKKPLAEDARNYRTSHVAAAAGGVTRDILFSFSIIDFNYRFITFAMTPDFVYKVSSACFSSNQPCISVPHLALSTRTW
jgi:hypothetical protein